MITHREIGRRASGHRGPGSPEVSRRDMLSRSAAVALLLAGAGVLPAQAQSVYTRAAFEGKNVDEVIKALGIAKPVESKDIVLTAPDIAENGAVVPIAASSTLSGVKRIAFLVDKNPTTLAGMFDFTEFVETSISTRIKMQQTSNVIAVAITGDGKVLFAQKEVKVTLGGCGG
jgi:sulfur-oxidizing protein SoxY